MMWTDFSKRMELLESAPREPWVLKSTCKQPTKT